MCLGFVRFSCVRFCAFRGLQVMPAGGLAVFSASRQFWQVVQVCTPGLTPTPGMCTGGTYWVPGIALRILHGQSAGPSNLAVRTEFLSSSPAFPAALPECPIPSSPEESFSTTLGGGYGDQAECFSGLLAPCSEHRSVSWAGSDTLRG